MDKTCLCLLCMEELEDSLKHPLCQSCLEKINEDRNISCQACKTKTWDCYKGASESLEPVEESASKTSKTDDAEGGIRSKKMKDLIDGQRNITQNLLLDSEKLKSEIKVYDDFLLENMTQHEAHLRKLHELMAENEKIIKEIKNERDRLIEKQKEFEVLKGCVEDKLTVLNNAKSTTVAVTLIDQLDRSFSGLEKWCELGQADLPNKTIVTLSEKVLRVTSAAVSEKTHEGDIKIPDFPQTDLTMSEKLAKLTRGSTLTIKEFTAMTESVKKALEEGQIYAVLKTVAGVRCSALTVEQDQIYLNCLKEEEPPLNAHTIKMKELIDTLDKDSTVVFMDLAGLGKSRERVNIQLLPESSQTRLFLSLCLGDLGASYLDSKFLSKESIGFYDYVAVGGSQNNDLVGGTSLARMDILPPFCSEGALFFRSDEIEKTVPAQFSITIPRCKSSEFPRCMKPKKNTLFSSGTETQTNSTGFSCGNKPVKKDNESSAGNVPSRTGFSFDGSSSAQSTGSSYSNKLFGSTVTTNGCFGLFDSSPSASTKDTTQSTGLFGSTPTASNKDGTQSTGLIGSTPAARAKKTTQQSAGIFGFTPTASATDTTQSTVLFDSTPAASSKETTQQSTGLFGSSFKQGSNSLFGTDPDKKIPIFSPVTPFKKNDEVSADNELDKEDSKLTKDKEPSEGRAGFSGIAEVPKESTGFLPSTSGTTFSFGPKNILSDKYVFGHIKKGLDLLNRVGKLKDINDVVIVNCGVLLPAYKPL